MKKIILVLALHISMLGLSQGNTHTQSGGKFEGLE